jgi:putative DNA methylase
MTRSERRSYLRSSTSWTNRRVCRSGALALQPGLGGHRRQTPSNMFFTTRHCTFYNYGARALPALDFVDSIKMKNYPSERPFGVTSHSAKNIQGSVDLFITDPPYANSIKYEEITEFFIAWLRTNPPQPFNGWVWDSSRHEAIKGSGENFRRDVVAAYAAMTQHMPGNGIQIVMFTHQDAGVWADLGAILWAAGLSVTAAWNVVTEIAKPSGEGNYVQGTVCLVLRKRQSEANARRMEIEAEIEQAVEQQFDRLTALGDAWTGETLYTDRDLTLAAYAAALRVVTSYSTIDRQPLDRDLYRKLDKGERTMIRDLVDYAAQVANGLLVPTDFPRDAWRDLGSAERFYIRMLDMEAKGATKVADFQNFAKSFAYGEYTTLMASTAANAASLASAADLKGRMLDGEGFAKTQLRQVLFAVWKTLEKGDPKLGVTTLRTEYAADYWQRRQKLIGLAEYVAAKTKTTRPEESAAAHELSEALKLDRV